MIHVITGQWTWSPLVCVYRLLVISLDRLPSALTAVSSDVETRW